MPSQLCNIRAFFSRTTTIRRDSAERGQGGGTAIGVNLNSSSLKHLLFAVVLLASSSVSLLIGCKYDYYYDKYIALHFVGQDDDHVYFLLEFGLACGSLAACAVSLFLCVGGYRKRGRLARTIAVIVVCIAVALAMYSLFWLVQIGRYTISDVLRAIDIIRG